VALLAFVRIAVANAPEVILGATMAFTRPTRMARAATKREHDCFAPPWGRAVFFVAAAARPSASRHADVHPTDALGARRYEEGARTPRVIVVEGQHSS